MTSPPSSTDPDTSPLARIESLQAENAALRSRLATIEAELARTSRASPLPPSPAVPDLTDRSVLLAIIDNAPSIIFVKDLQGRYILLNKAFERTIGVPRDALLGKTDDDLFGAELGKNVRAFDQQVISGGEPVMLDETVPVKGEPRSFFTVKFPLYHEGGKLIGICGITADITDRRHAEAERDALREQVIVTQQNALREVSTPLIPIAQGVLAMPLVGAIDDARAAQIMESLLEGVTAHGAHTAIVDITGVRQMDAHVAGAIVNAARAARLLGASVVLSGIRPDVARTLVELGTDLTGIAKLGTLQAAIVHALKR